MNPGSRCTADWLLIDTQPLATTASRANATRVAIRGIATSYAPPPRAENELGARELLVRNPVRPVGLGPEPLVAVFLVGLEVAFEPDDLRIALEGEHVGRDAV